MKSRGTQAGTVLAFLHNSNKIRLELNDEGG